MLTITTADQVALDASIEQEKRYHELLHTMINHDRTAACAQIPAVADVYKLLDVAEEFG